MIPHIQIRYRVIEEDTSRFQKADKLTASREIEIVNACPPVEFIHADPHLFYVWHFGGAFTQMVQQEAGDIVAQGRLGAKGHRIYDGIPNQFRDAYRMEFRILKRSKN